MTRCPSPVRLLCLHCRSSLRPPFAAVPSPLPAAPRFGWRLQWNKQYSVGDKRSVFDSDFLKDLNRLNPPERRGPTWQGKRVRPWISLLEEIVRRNSKNAGAHSTSIRSSGITRKSFAETIDLAHLLNTARRELNRDLLAHLGYKSNNWSVVYVILNGLLDAAEAVAAASSARRGVLEDRAVNLGLSLDQLTDEDSFSPQFPRYSRITGLESLDSLTYRPFSQEYYMLLMAEVWKSLGAITLYAVDTSPTKSRLAMSVVYRILARLHHSGLVSERVYKYTTPDTYQATFRPPGMHLLSTHIMDVLSDAAWTVHEAQVAAEAAAAGKDPPFLPAKISIKELGHEIWLEFILWCCVEHGHIKEGIWLLDELTGRKGWKFQSWTPILYDEEALRNTRIDREVSTWPLPYSVNVTPEPPKRTDPPSLFHGLGKRTISVEIVTALLDNLSNLVHMGMGAGGIPASELFRRIDNLKFAIASATTSKSKLLPTTKAVNWFTTRVMESGGLVPEADPQTFDNLLKLTPHVVPPWSNGMCPLEEDTLAALHPSQLYDDTCAFTGLMEYNLKYHSSRKFTGSALNLFAMLQAVMDTCKMRRLDDFFSSQMEGDSANPPSSYSDSVLPFISSIPQLSNVTIAHLFDLVTVSRAFAFGEWLLLSDDIDGPTVPVSAYGDQALAPSLLRFAAATKNDYIGETVVQSLGQPVSLNTLRAILNYRIIMHQWDQVIPILRYIRDNRIKSWAHSNIAAIAAEIIRLDHALILSSKESNLANTATSEIETNLAEAKRVLYRILFGEFDEKPWRKRGNRNFQAHSLISFTRLFRHSRSPSLTEIAGSVFESEYVPMYRLPYIPSTAFHTILAAIAETEGTLAAKKIYKRFCVSYNSPEFSRLVVGGITRFYKKAERDFQRGDPNFDAEYFHHLQKKMVFPNPNTVRILTQAAVREYYTAVAEMETEAKSWSESSMPNLEDTAAEQAYDQTLSPSFPDAEVSPRSSSTPPPLSPAERKTEAERTLIFCIKRFKVFHMSDTEIAREVGEEFYSNYQKANEDRREWDRRTKSELKKKWERREKLKKRLEETEETLEDITNDARAKRKERRKLWQKTQKLKQKLRRSEKVRNDVKLNVLLNMTRSEQVRASNRDWERKRRPKRVPVPRTRSEMRRMRKDRGIEKRKKWERDEGADEGIKI
ncbi:hypothetical protein BDW66DRAFT_111349 [Aspergillus desertorum]